MNKRTLALALAVVAIAAVVPNFALAAREQFKDCRQIPVRLGAHDIHAAGRHVHIPARSNPTVCVTWDREVAGTPTITFLRNCGDVCFVVRLADVAVYQDVHVEISWSEDGVRQSVPVDPSPIDLTRELDEACWGHSGEGAGDPCTTTITTPQNLTAQGRKAKILLTWKASQVTSSSNSVTKYEIWRSETGAPDTFQQIAEATSTSFKDTGLTSGQTFTYYVVAVASDGARSAGSSNATATAR
ncbi:MAG: fibronectin type III domain-containing protein [Actinomycetota bacterium]|nr:fibronectin type III domain-containing protein [Actinomycetota bacterium]